MAMTLDELTNAVAGGAAAIRAVTQLEPAGGAGDKVFPPTYVKEGRGETKYAMERRRIDGREVETVLLDSVASQANRMEEALLEGWRRKQLTFPVVWVDFSGEEGLQDLEQISALQAPHRIADALLRDSVFEGTPFRDGHLRGEVDHVALHEGVARDGVAQPVDEPAAEGDSAHHG